MGIDSTMLTREKSIARRAEAALTSSTASTSTKPRVRFCFDQITNQTLNHMIAPSHMPIPMAVYLGTPSVLSRIASNR